MKNCTQLVISMEKSEQGLAVNDLENRGDYGVVSFTEKPQTTEDVDDDGHLRRTGTFYTGTAHAITACIGSGVLSLAWAVAQLGWIAGPLVNILFAVITFYTSVLLADSYRYMNPVNGKRLYTYMGVVKAYLGRVDTFVCGLVQYVNLFGVCTGYTITASVSMVAIKRVNCFHNRGRQADCHVSNILYMAIFGAIQMVFSQIPDFAETWWLSVLATIMSFSYSGIGLGLILVRLIGNGYIRGTLYGWPIGDMKDDYTAPQKTWKSLSALGDISFAYGFTIVLFNIQDTLKSHPAENKTMRKVSLTSILTCSIFYLSVGCTGYAVFGKHAPGNLLTDLGFFEPYWLLDIANVCIVIHLVGAYQIFAQPIFSFVESAIMKRWPEKKFLHQIHRMSITGIGTLKISIFRLVWRTIFVLITTLIALLLPFFNSIIGLLGSLAFFPLSVYFPIRIYMVRKSLQPFTAKWWFLCALMASCLLVSLGAALGSTASIVQDTKHYQPFS